MPCREIRTHVLYSSAMQFCVRSLKKPLNIQLLRRQLKGVFPLLKIAPPCFSSILAREKKRGNHRFSSRRGEMSPVPHQSFPLNCRPSGCILERRNITERERGGRARDHQCTVAENISLWREPCKANLSKEQRLSQLLH